MQNKQYMSLCIVALVLGQAFALPQQIVQPERLEGGRKFAEKPNASKKVTNDDLEDVSTNSIQEQVGAGFSWSSMLGMLMQMLLGQTANIASPSKNDVEEGTNVSPWANLLTMGLKVLNMILGGPQQQIDGIDKVDNAPSSPMQFISIVINLLDALKTSFSHRSFQARSLGKKDTVSEAAVASISMLKGYVRSMKSFGNVGRAEEEGQRGCAERALCEASAECAADTQGTNTIFCQLGSYATSFLIQRQSGVGFEALYEAGRRGRSGEDCRTIFLDCNAV
ncbi:hypothetical protein QAD02_019653 [Eretmocerus hayati]|uniref:Uncharacterized protein n=1 Tax=Eretmocerus hayati TaxID=131215 RepID=A0ACC2PM27_9HYME|nr:hypothetical protein QAD02_019653 [Eretmocerus hayati]